MLNEYMATLGQIELLTPEREAALWHAFRVDGDAEARAALIEHYQPLVFKEALRWNLQESLLLDLIQEGTVGLIEAAERYDYERGVAFSLFARHRIRGRMIDYLRAAGTDIPVDDSVWEDGRVQFDLLTQTASDAFEVTDRKLLFEAVTNAVARLPERERQVVAAIYLDEREPKEVAATLAVSKAYVYRLQKTGIRRLRGMLSRLMHERK